MNLQISVVPSQEKPRAYLGGSYTPENGFQPLEKVSAYPPELLAQGRDISWVANPVKCRTCNRPGSPSFFDETRLCFYCQNGIT